MSMLDAGRCAAFVLLACVAVHARADSFASSASSAGSASSGASSDSLHGSSGSSSHNDRHGAAVEYRVVAVDDAVDHPGHARLTLQAADPDERLQLDIPQGLAQRERFAPGDIVTSRERVYGWAFARGGVADPFFLVIADDWQARFAPRRVS